MRLLYAGEGFPPAENAGEEGLLAFGGDLSPNRLKEAYSKGIFPWFDQTQPILWWCPDPRMVLYPQDLKVSKSMRQLLRKDFFRVSFNQEFQKVITSCASVKREGQQGTWITREMQQAYLELHRQGWAHSVEVWSEGTLVGGLYGILLRSQKIFCGESMFSYRSNASKFGFIKLVEKLREEGIRLIDCQVYSSHLESLGAVEIPRQKFLEYLYTKG